jgi:hypothetical protein
MFHEFELVEHILIIVAFFILLTRKSPIFFIIIVVSVLIQLGIVWDLKDKIIKENCFEHKVNFLSKTIKIC